MLLRATGDRCDRRMSIQEVLGAWYPILGWRMCEGWSIGSWYQSLCCHWKPLGTKYIKPWTYTQPLKKRTTNFFNIFFLNFFVEQNCSYAIDCWLENWLKTQNHPSVTFALCNSLDFCLIFFKMFNDTLISDEQGREICGLLLTPQCDKPGRLHIGRGHTWVILCFQPVF